VRVSGSAWPEQTFMKRQGKRAAYGDEMPVCNDEAVIGLW
jgi:hypothetical protein